MVKRSTSDWQALFQQQLESGLSANAFCKQNKLCSKYFSLRKKQLMQSDITPLRLAPAFVPTKIIRSATCHKDMVLSYHGMQLTLPLSINEVWVANLLKALA